MGRKLYVGNLSFNTSDADLQQLFSEHGTILSAQVIMDRATGQSHQAALPIHRRYGASRGNRASCATQVTGYMSCWTNREPAQQGSKPVENPRSGSATCYLLAYD